MPPQRGPMTPEDQHTMAGSRWDGTSSFTSSLQHTCAGGRTLGAHKCILSPRMVNLKQQPSVSLTIQGLMSLSCKAIIIFFSDLKCSTKECHIISKLLHISLWGAALQLSLKVFTISTLYLWCSYKLLYLILYISLMNFWNFIKNFLYSIATGINFIFMQNSFYALDLCVDITGFMVQGNLSILYLVIYNPIIQFYIIRLFWELFIILSIYEFSLNYLTMKNFYVTLLLPFILSFDFFSLWYLLVKSQLGISILHHFRITCIIKRVSYILLK